MAKNEVRLFRAEVDPHGVLIESGVKLGGFGQLLRIRYTNGHIDNFAEADEWAPTPEEAVEKLRVKAAAIAKLAADRARVAKQARDMTNRFIDIWLESRKIAQRVVTREA